MLCMTDFEKKHLQLKTEWGCVISKFLSVHTRKSVPQWALKLKTVLVTAEYWDLKDHMLKVKHTIPVYMSRTKLLYFDSNTGALNRETIHRHKTNISDLHIIRFLAVKHVFLILQSPLNTYNKNVLTMR